MATKETSSVLTKTTKPSVIVQTQKVGRASFSEESAFRTFCKGRWIWKALVILLLLVNAAISFLSYLTVKEHFRFTLMSNGGVENYQMLKVLYASPAFQQASTLSIYQLIERIDQTLASVQSQTEEAAQP